MNILLAGYGKSTQKLPPIPVFGCSQHLVADCDSFSVFVRPEAEEPALSGVEGLDMTERAPGGFAKTA